MIGRLKGAVASELPDGTVVIDVQGVGYEVVVPIGTLGRVVRDEAGRVTLLIHTHVREDAIVLFGFADERERLAFRMLTAVAGVGPKIAVAILGVLPAGEMAAAVIRGDSRRFQSVPGVGKKIAERLVLELKDKLANGVLSGGVNGTAVHGGSVVPSSSAVVKSGQSIGALVEALVRMGFKPMEAERAAAEMKVHEGQPLDVLVREALRVLT